MIRNFLAAVLAATLSFAAFATDANRATQAELESLKGIGPALATKILSARANGSFAGWPDLIERVGGVGPANAARLSQAGLTVGGNAFDPAALPAAQKPAKPRAAKADTAGRSDKAAKPGAV